MRRRLSEQRGFALTELLVVMMISTVLLSATLLTFERMVTNENTNDTRNDTAELARNSLDIQARQVRNLAKRVNAATIDTVQPFDFIFQTSDPSRTWVRYCLDTSLGTDKGRLYELVNPTATGITAGMRGSCVGAAGWTTTRVAATNVTNRIGGVDRAIFKYRCVDNTTACTSSASTFDKIVGVNTALYIDTTPVGGPPELKVNTSVFLRNQNQAPVAVIASSTVSSASRTILLNASGSSDYEGRTLSYYWFLGAMPNATTPPRRRARRARRCGAATSSAAGSSSSTRSPARPARAARTRRSASSPATRVTATRIRSPPPR
jgi:prepilin-type N-terminal cleavage/methylation domain-containing protein